MYVSMNGPTGPSLPVPTWLLAGESNLWEKGIPECFPTVEREGVCGGEQCLMVFANHDDARSLIDRSEMTGLRPVAVNDLRLFLAILGIGASGGLKHVVRVVGKPSGHDYHAIAAAELYERIATAIRARRG